MNTIIQQTADIKSYALTNDRGLDVKFDGQLIGMSSSLSNSNRKRWTDLNLYLTEAGSYVCEEIGKSTVTGEKDLREVQVVKSVDDVIDFFGDGWLAKELYRSAKIDAAINVA